MRAPQAQTRGSTSKIFLTRRAHVLRASLEKEERSTVEDIDTPEGYFRLTGETLASALARRAHGK
jgi:hypothetical protein